MLTDATILDASYSYPYLLAMYVALLIAQGLLVLAFLGAGGAKLAGADQMIDDFERFGYPQSFRVFTGLCEVVGAALLIAGFWWPVAAALGALLLVCVMIGAVWTHLARAGDPVGQAAPPLVLGALAVWVAVAQSGALL